MNGRTNSNIEKSSELKIQLEPVSGFTAILQNGTVVLTWTDPLDKYSTVLGDTADTSDQLICEWEYTKIIRKAGSQPTGFNDGDVVIESRTRNQYSTHGYEDTNLPTDIEYFYAAYAVSTIGVESTPQYQSVTVFSGTTIKDLELGHSLIANINSVPVEFMVVAQGNPDDAYYEEHPEFEWDRTEYYSKNAIGTWIMSKDVYGEHPFGEDNRYWDSDMHQYVNTEIYNQCDQLLKDAILEIKIPAADTSGTIQRGENGLSARIFLPSGSDCQLNSYYNSTNYDTAQGHPLPYFYDNDTNNSKLLANYNGSPSGYVFRSANRISGTRRDYISAITSNGRYNTLESISAHTSDRFRIMMVLNENAKIDPNNVLISSGNA